MLAPLPQDIACRTLSRGELTAVIGPVGAGINVYVNAVARDAYACSEPRIFVWPGEEIGPQRATGR
jgi:hypothetical protein